MPMHHEHLYKNIKESVICDIAMFLYKIYTFFFYLYLTQNTNKLKYTYEVYYVKYNYTLRTTIYSFFHINQ